MYNASVVCVVVKAFGSRSTCNNHHDNLSATCNFHDTDRTSIRMLRVIVLYGPVSSMSASTTPEGMLSNKIDGGVAHLHFCHAIKIQVKEGNMH